MTKTFFLNSTLADYGEEEFNYIQKFLLQQGILNTEGADYNDFIDLQVSQHSAGDMSVDVAVGVAVINTLRSGVSFKVFASNQAVENLVVGNNTSGSNRVDAVILKLSRTVEPNALMNNVATLQVVAGSGVSALADNAIQTAIGADYDFIRLADITVSHNETAILTADIADTRVRCYNTDATVPNPTIIKFRQLTADPTTPVEGEMWYNTTDNILRYFDGSVVINIQASVYTGGNGINVTAGVITAVAKSGGGILVGASGLEIDETLAKKFLTLPAYENLVAGDLLKPYDDGGTVKLKKIHGIKDLDQTTTTLYGADSPVREIVLALTDSLIITGGKDIYSQNFNIFAVNIDSAGVLTNGSTIVLNSGASPLPMRQAPQLIRVDDTTFIAVWGGVQANANTIFARAFSVSGTTITAGTLLTAITGSTGTDSYEHNSVSICNLDTNKFLLAWNVIGYDSQYMNGMVLTLSGTTITPNAVQRLSSTINNTFSNLVAVKMDTNKAVIVACYVPSSEYLRALIVSVSGTTISVSGENNIKTISLALLSGTYYRAFNAKQLDTDKFVVAYCSGTDTVGLITFSLSGTTFTEVSSASQTFTHQSSIPSIVVMDTAEVWVNVYNSIFQYYIGADLTLSKGSIYSGSATRSYSRRIMDKFKGALIFVNSMISAGSNYYYTSFRRFILDHAKFITSANSSYTAGDDVPIVDIFTGFSGLAIGNNYYIKPDATNVVEDSTYQKVGMAIGTNKIAK